MPNPYFSFKEFTVYHDRCAMKVTTDACLFGAWVACRLNMHEGENILDIGTGTGLLSLMVAQKNEVMTDAVEIDQDAAEQAAGNIKASPWKNRINIIQANIKFFNPGKRYRTIISNPPFYEKEIFSIDEKRNQAHHGSDLGFNDLIELIDSYLEDNGDFFLLIPGKRFAEMENIISRYTFHINESCMVHQTTSHDVFRIMIRCSKRNTATNKSRIFIRDEEGQYTNEFRQLLGDYYLYL